MTVKQEIARILCTIPPATERFAEKKGNLRKIKFYYQYIFPILYYLYFAKESSTPAIFNFAS